MHNTYIEIDKKQFIVNLKAIATWVNRGNKAQQKVKICLPVKANAYGHGLVGIAKLAQKYVDYLAVACLDEGVTLRQNGIKKPILVLGAFSQEQVYDLISNKLEITISSLLKAKFIIAVCQKLKLCCNVHIKVDTGINRVGVRPESAMALINFVYNSTCMKLIGVYSHLASSDKPEDIYTLHQIDLFKQIVTQVKKLNPKIICHIANSGGVCYYPDSYLDMVRPGIFSYGYLPNNCPTDSSLSMVQPFFCLKSQVIYFKVVANNSGISYNQRYTTCAQTRIITVPIGYGDGYPRMLSNHGEILVRGHKYTIAGAVCMDMLMADIGPDGSAYVGDEVVLIGKQSGSEISLDSVVQKCNTIPYDILCRFNERIPRRYV